MIVKSNAVKIALSRRATIEAEPDTRIWRKEFFDVTQDVYDNRKVTLAHTPISDTEEVRLNGLVLENDPDWDYTMNGNEVIFRVDHNLTVGDTIRVTYKA